MTSSLPPQTIESVTLSSDAGMQVTILNLGATIQSIRVPVKGAAVNVVLGYEELSDYWRDSVYMGATVGRYANRIRGAQFSLDGQIYRLDANDGATGNCLHGGRGGLHKRFWDLSSSSGATSVECHYTSPAGEGGFPGTLQTTVIYKIIDNYSLLIEFQARCDSDTVLSLANHAYFNLDNAEGTIDSHALRLNAERYTPVDKHGIPTGEIRSVEDSEFDLRKPTSLQSRAGSRSSFDHNFELAGANGELHEVAEISSQASGMRMRLLTTQVGLQFYTGDYLCGAFEPRQGLCLEAQAFPDAPNQAAFPSTRLAAGEQYSQRTVYEFVPPTT